MFFQAKFDMAKLAGIQGGTVGLTLVDRFGRKSDLRNRELEVYTDGKIEVIPEPSTAMLLGLGLLLLTHCGRPRGA